ncbi:unnamed protein product [Mytilus coruscus]|uniref:Immunoglobulin domain-containing protein n=1 Tax=Mytilus coruscus TaxID=42192 RepID=A0A6J8AHC1_MYTCO|nr:unnamed protein product [Mytilus coruscus]
MSAILALIGITIQIQMVSGIENETIKVKVQKGQTVVLKCSISEEGATWLGPDVTNAEQGMLVYFVNNIKNPELNQTKFSLQENEGGYGLIIFNFLEENAGFYICRFWKDGTFHEMRFNVSLVDMLPRTTFVYDEEGNTVPDNETGYATNTTILLEGHVIHIVGPNVHLPSIPIYYSAPESENSRHIYEQSIPQYLEVIESEEQDDLSDSNGDESTDEIIITVLDQISHDYEEIQ